MPMLHRCSISCIHCLRASRCNSGCWLIVKICMAAHLITQGCYLQDCPWLIVSVWPIRSSRVGMFQIPSMNRCDLGPRKWTFCFVTPVLWNNTQTHTHASPDSSRPNSAGISWILENLDVSSGMGPVDWMRPSLYVLWTYWALRFEFITLLCRYIICCHCCMFLILFC